VANQQVHSHHDKPLHRHTVAIATASSWSHGFADSAMFVLGRCDNPIVRRVTELARTD
jgi:hypothetical protein